MRVFIGLTSSNLGLFPIFGSGIFAFRSSPIQHAGRRERFGLPLGLKELSRDRESRSMIDPLRGGARWMHEVRWCWKFACHGAGRIELKNILSLGPGKLKIQHEYNYFSTARIWNKLSEDSRAWC